MSAQDLLLKYTFNAVETSPAASPNDIPAVTLAAGGLTAFNQLSGTESVTISATNEGTTTLVGVGLWIDLATFPGDYTVRSASPPETDFIELIRMGDQALAAGGPLLHEDAAAFAGYQNGGLWVRPTGGTIWYRVSSLRGVSKPTRIGNVDLAVGASTGWELVLDIPSGATATRYYFDVMVEDVT